MSATYAYMYSPRRLLHTEPRHPLARAGQSDIYRAECADEPGSQVALKIFKSSTQDARREREIDILFTLEHPGIVNIIDELRDTSGLAVGMVLEFLSGQTLSAFLKTRPDLSTRLKIFTHILEAVEYAHSKEIFHHDLKLSNVMIEPDGRVVLLDFGLAYVVGSDPITAMGYMMGTPTSMAPEMCSVGPDSRASNAGDIFCLGVMLYEMVTLQPYRRHAVEVTHDIGMDSRRGHVSRHFRNSPEGIALEDLIGDMLQREQIRRPSVSVICYRYQEIDTTSLIRTYVEDALTVSSSREPPSHRDAPTKADEVDASPPTPESSDSPHITIPTLVSPVFAFKPPSQAPEPLPPIPRDSHTPSMPPTHSSLYIIMALFLLIGIAIGFAIHALH